MSGWVHQNREKTARLQDGDAMSFFLSVILTLNSFLSQASPPVVEPLEVPSGEVSHLPNLAVGADGKTYLTWVEPLDGGGDHLRFSVLQEGKGWSEARTIASGKNWFVNWADFPSMTALEDGTLAAHWLARLGEGTYAYGVKLSISRDAGDTWSSPIIPHSDRSPTEHGFVALRPLDEGHFFVAWLDGREMAAGSHGSGEMGIRSITLAADGTLGVERLLDSRVCECCPVDALVRNPGDVLVVYRDRSIEEIRDIHGIEVGPSKSRQLGPIHDDGWNREGCPVNGPAIATSGGIEGVVWYTEVEERGQVRCRLLTEDIGSFIRIDDGNPIGRVDLAPLPGGEFAACWIEKVGDQGQIRVRRFNGDRTPGRSHTIATVDPGRRSGYPRIVSSGSTELLVAWTALNEGSKATTQIRSARIRLDLTEGSSTESQ